MSRVLLPVLAALVALAVGVGIGWLVFGGGAGEESDADRACAAAEELPAELEQQEERDADDVAVLNRIAGVGLLAQSTGQTGEDFDDLDELGRAGRDLYATLQQFDLDGYADARAALLDACEAR